MDFKTLTIMADYNTFSNIGRWFIPIAIVVASAIVAIISKIKRNKKVKNPRTEKIIEKELKETLNSEDRKVRGILLVWCLLTGFMIAQGIILGGNEFVNWIHAGFLLALLILVIKGRGSRRLIFITTGLLTILLLESTINMTGTRLRTSYCFSDWNHCLIYYDVPDYIWENEASIRRIGGIIMASYYGATTLYFCFSKRAKRHFAWGEKKAELWLELKNRDKLRGMGKPQTYSEPKEDFDNDNNSDEVETELKELLEENRKLANRIEKLEQKTKRKAKDNEI